MEIWERVRLGLRELRGAGEWRGNEQHLIGKREIRLQLEPRGGTLRGKEVVLHLSDAEVEVWAEERPGGRQYYLKDFQHDLIGFLRQLTALCGAGGYLHTNSSRADYRRNKEQQHGKGETE
jgi:hypothetical protein